MDSELIESKWFLLKESNDEHKLRINIYQIFTRLFGNKIQNNIEFGTIEENGVGKFNDISETALNEIKNLGITHIWYTGIIEHAVLTDYSKYNIPLDDADVVKGRAGSPYAIKDYYDVNPDLAEDVNNRMQEFENLVRRTHDQNLKVIIDFVPNHVARSYRSDVKPNDIEDLGEGDDQSKKFHPDNNFYYLVGQKFEVPKNYTSLGNKSFITKDGHFDENPAKATGNDRFTHQPDINDWFETIKINYGYDYENNTKHFHPLPSTWKKMRDILLYWAGKKIDGFRCDMAEMVPVEFWNWVIPEIKKAFPEIIFIAEIYNPQQYHNYIFNGMFDFLYDKVQLYDTLRNILLNQCNTDQITPIWQYLRGINKNMLRFLENHDEQRIASPFFTNDPFEAIPAMAVSAFLYTGPVMIYFGQEVGEPGKGNSGFSGDDGRTTIFDYWGIPEHQKWMNEGKFDGGLLSQDQRKLRNIYKELLNIRLNHPALYEGGFLDLHTLNQNYNSAYPQNLYSFIRFTSEEKLLILCNFNDEHKNVLLQFPEELFTILNIDILKNYNYEIIFSNEAIHLKKLSGSFIRDSQSLSFYFTCSNYSAYVIKILEDAK